MNPILQDRTTDGENSGYVVVNNSLKNESMSVGLVVVLSPTMGKIPVANPGCVRKGMQCQTCAKPISHSLRCGNPNREQPKWKFLQ